MRIDNSQLKTYSNCPYLYKLKYIDCLRKVDYTITDMDLNFGSCIHSALEHFNKNGCTDKAMGEGIGIFRESYIDIPDEKTKTRDNGEILLNDYLAYHRANFSQWEILEVETVDSVRIGADLDWLVKIDIIVKYNGNIFVVDYKSSTAKNRNMYFLSFDPNQQVSGYTYYCKKKYGQCAGFIPVVLFMGHRMRKYKGEPAGYWNKTEHTIIGRTKEQLEDFEKNVQIWHGKLEDSIITDSFPKNEDNCHSYRGCGYRPLCLSCNDECIRESMFEQHNPLKYLEK